MCSIEHKVGGYSNQIPRDRGNVSYGSSETNGYSNKGDYPQENY